MQISSTLGSPTSGSYSSAAPTPQQERTKGDDTAPTVPAHGTVATKITQAVSAWAALPQFGVPYTPRSQVDLGRLAGPSEGITPFTVTTKKNPCNRRRKGVTSGGASNKRHDCSHDHQPTDYTLP
jgi:hypothetical protein